MARSCIERKPARRQPQVPIWMAADRIALARCATTQVTIATAAARPPQAWAAERYATREIPCTPDQQRDTALCHPRDDRRFHPKFYRSRRRRLPTPPRFRRGRTPAPRLLRPPPQNFPLRAAVVRLPAIPLP